MAYMNNVALQLYKIMFGNCKIQPFIRAQIKQNIKAPRQWPPVAGEFRVQEASSAANFLFDDVILIYHVSL